MKGPFMEGANQRASQLATPLTGLGEDARRGEVGQWSGLVQSLAWRGAWRGGFVGQELIGGPDRAGASYILVLLPSPPLPGPGAGSDPTPILPIAAQTLALQLRTGRSSSERVV
jgi:hypothetical protein